jgi:hypothetical protein
MARPGWSPCRLRLEAEQHSKRGTEDRMKRIALECLRCGHCSSIPEERLRTFGLSPDAPIAKFIQRLTCTECGSHSVRAYRYDLEDAD